MHELVVPFVRERPPEASPERTSGVSVRRVFPPGSDWLYARIYTGPTTTDGYDAVGNKVEGIDPNGNKTTFYYDGSGRMTVWSSAVRISACSRKAMACAAMPAASSAISVLVTANR